MIFRYILVLFLTGCASYTPKLAPTEIANLSDSYIYGRLYIDVPSAPLAFDGHVSMGFVLKCDDGNVYTLRFYNKNPVFVVKAKPSICSFKETIYTDVDGKIRGRQEYLGNDLQKLKLSSGVANYIGDYVVSFDVTYSASAHTYTWAWQLSDKKNNYSGTTQEMKIDFPYISVLPTMDLSN